PLAEFRSNVNWFLKNRQILTQSCVLTTQRNGKKVHILALINEAQLRRLLARIWDPEEFRSPYGLRSLSKYHHDYPFVFAGSAVRYEPAESTVKIKGGNANWRGPIWFPTTFMMIESLRKLSYAYGRELLIESPVAGEPPVSINDMAKGFADRLIAL